MTPMTRRRAQTLFSNVKTEGGILPQEILERVVLGDKDLPGLDNESYHLAKHERIGEAINRSWSRLQGLWSGFQEAVEKLPEEDLAIALTRDRWLLPLFQELGYGRLPKKSAMEVDKKAYAISHAWHRSPIHLMGCRVTIDKRMKGVAGAAMASPHGLVQDFLNRSDDHLWGFVSNGFTLRALRDNYSLTRQAYVEFDLQAIMTGEQFSEFRLLWLICHQSRVESEKPEDCWLEKWFKLSRDEGIRALDKLRNGVANAISDLGAGFLKHRSNKKLRDALSNGKLDAQEYYRQLLRLVYRLIFLFVAEDRDALLDSNAPEEAKQRYLRFYTTRRLRTLSSIHRGGSHKDLWQGLRLVMDKLDDGCQDLGLPALGSFLWSKDAIPFLEESEIANEHLMSAIRSLCYITDKKQVYPVNWRNIGSEELGSIYESLLELHPKLNKEAGTFELATAAGHERKTTGSYYTPSSLVDCLLDSALEPVLDEAAKKQDPEAAILDLKVCDPACGSGHFLVAAAWRIAKRLAAIRAGEDEPSPESVQTAIRDVVGRCVYGVDINPMAVELCKVALWMEALDPGKPLSFLDHRIQCGNSLLGAVPALLEKGIPNEAFKPIEGDDKKFCSKWRKRNKKERENKQETLFDATNEPWDKLGNIANSLTQILDVDDNTIDGVRKRQELYEQMVKSSGYLYGRLWADAWCISFVWKKTRYEDLPYPITEDVFRKIENNPHSIPVWMRDEIIRLADQYNFFHWHLAFPDVFTIPGEEPESKLTGWSGGFDVVLGNPPWERIKIQEKEWFSTRKPEIAEAPNAAARRKMIKSLHEDDPSLFRAFTEDLRTAEGESQLVRLTGRYPLCGRGDVNTYAIFAELNRNLIGTRGRVGCILPSGIATDDTTKFFFSQIMEGKELSSFFSFKEIRAIFVDTDSRNPFALLTLNGRETSSETAHFAFFLESTNDLSDDERIFSLSASDIALLNPNTHTCPVFRTSRDAEITKGIYRRIPVLIKEGPPEENPWGISFMRMFDMANDSHLFRTKDHLESDGWTLEGNVFTKGDQRYLPLYEAKMIHHFNHRFGDYADKPPDSQSTALPKVPLSRLQDPKYVVLPRYWVPEIEVEERLKGRWDRGWLLGWRDICRSTDERTVIASVVPRVGVGHKFPLMLSQHPIIELSLLLGGLTSLAFDYIARQKIGGTSLTYFTTKQLPFPHTEEIINTLLRIGCVPPTDWVLPRVLELVHTSSDIGAFASECGYQIPPFGFDEERRFLIRCELDAAFFHLYLGTPEKWRENGSAELLDYFPTPRDAVKYIMGTFPIVKRKDIAAHGDYRTKLQILEIYDRMQRAIDTGEPYKTRLDPPPADPRVTHNLSPERK